MASGWISHIIHATNWPLLLFITINLTKVTCPSIDIALLSYIVVTATTIIIIITTVMISIMIISI